MERPRSEGCAYWPGIARQIARSGYFDFAFSPISTRRRIGLIIGHGPLPGPSPERDSAGIEPGQCDGREPPIGLGAEERMVDTKAMEVVVEEGDRLV
jgi:hypothetical protein